MDLKRGFLVLAAAAEHLMESLGKPPYPGRQHPLFDHCRECRAVLLAIDDACAHCGLPR